MQHNGTMNTVLTYLLILWLQTLHDDLATRRQAVGDTIDRCNRLLRETTSDDADDIRGKLATIRDQADYVHRLSTDRLRALEDALPVAQHFVATHSDLRAWLDEIDAEIRSIDIMADGSSEQIRKQVDSAKVDINKCMQVFYICLVCFVSEVVCAKTFA